MSFELLSELTDVSAGQHYEGGAEEDDCRPSEHVDAFGALVGGHGEHIDRAL